MNCSSAEQSMEKEISCGFVLYQKTPELRFLLLKLPRPREWDFPKGHKEDSETFYDTAKRELMEEVNLDAVKDIIVAQNGADFASFTYEYESPTKSIRKIVLFVGECRKNPVISS